MPDEVIGLSPCLIHSSGSRQITHQRVRRLRGSTRTPDYQRVEAGNSSVMPQLRCVRCFFRRVQMLDCLSVLFLHIDHTNIRIGSLLAWQHVEGLTRHGHSLQSLVILNTNSARPLICADIRTVRGWLRMRIDLDLSGRISAEGGRAKPATQASRGTGATLEPRLPTKLRVVSRCCGSSSGSASTGPTE
jgi:hypothetical protein